MQERYLAWGRVKNKMREITAYGNARKAEIGAENVFDFSLGSPSAPVPEAVREAMLAALAREDCHEPTPQEGLPEFRAAVAEDLNRRYDLGLDAGCIHVATGAAGALAVSIHALLKPGEEAVVLAPFFSEYRVFIEGAGGTVVPVGAEESLQPDLAAFAAAITEKTRLVLVNTPNNPSGVVLSEESLAAMSRILSEAQERFGHAVYLVSDEPYRELLYEGGAVPCVLKAYDNSILCYSFSKSLSLPGERIGYLALNRRMAEREAVFAAVKEAARALGYTGAPALMQRALIGCLGLTADVSIYKHNRDLLYDGLTALGFSCVKPEGAFYLFMKAPIEDAEAFSDAARKYELLLVPSDSFGVPGYLRLAYCVPTAAIERSLPAFRKLAEEYGLV